MVSIQTFEDVLRIEFDYGNDASEFSGLYFVLAVWDGKPFTNA